MTRKIAVAVIHGMGRQEKNDPDNSAALSFSVKLHKQVRKRWGREAFDAEVAWREIYWADVLQPRQDEYLAAISRATRKKWMRQFVLSNLTDAAAYRQSTDVNDNTYDAIHEKVKRTIAELEDDVSDGAPLVVLAHSLGGHVMSNYIYDMASSIRRGAPNAPTPFQQFRRMAGLVTFGCNLPVFTFAIPRDKIVPIAYPGTDIPPDRRLKPWWRNYYDKDDVLGYPLRHISDKYMALHTSGEMKDYAIDTGWFPIDWTVLSHNAYWRDPDIYRPVTDMLKRAMG